MYRRPLAMRVPSDGQPERCYRADQVVPATGAYFLASSIVHVNAMYAVHPWSVAVLLGAGSECACKSGRLLRFAERVACRWKPLAFRAAARLLQVRPQKICKACKCSLLEKQRMVSSILQAVEFDTKGVITTVVQKHSAHALALHAAAVLNMVWQCRLSALGGQQACLRSTCLRKDLPSFSLVAFAGAQSFYCLQIESGFCMGAACGVRAGGTSSGRQVSGGSSLLRQCT